MEIWFIIRLLYSFHLQNLTTDTKEWRVYSFNCHGPSIKLFHEFSFQTNHFNLQYCSKSGQTMKSIFIFFHLRFMLPSHKKSGYVWCTILILVVLRKFDSLNFYSVKYGQNSLLLFSQSLTTHNIVAKVLKLLLL